MESFIANFCFSKSTMMYVEYRVELWYSILSWYYSNMTFPNVIYVVFIANICSFLTFYYDNIFSVGEIRFDTGYV